MYLQPQRSSVTKGAPIWQNHPETAMGGYSLDTSNLVIGSVLPGGTPMHYDDSTRTAKAIITAVMADVATNSATQYKVKKGHLLKVGDALAAEAGGDAYAISTIDTSNADYDTVTVATTLGKDLVAGDVLFVSGAAGADAATVDVCNGLNYQDEIVQVDAPVSIGIRGTIYERRIPGVSAAMKAQVPTIIFSQSY